MALSRDAILDSQDRKKEQVQVPEWGGSLWLWELSAKEYVEFYDEVSRRQKSGAKDPYGAVLVYYSARDDEGQRLFTDPADIDRLSEKNALVMTRLSDIAVRINGLGETTAKNSEAGQAGASPTDSPLPLEEPTLTDSWKTSAPDSLPNGKPMQS